MLLTSKNIVAGAMALCALIHAGSALALTDVPSALKQTQNQNWHIRAAGLKAIEDADDASHPVLSDAKIRGTLIALLQRETSFHDSRQHYAGYSDYYSDLLAQVASWKDSRALPVLMDARVITTGNIATRGVAEFGDVAVGPVLARYKMSSDILERVSLLSVLDHIAANRATLSAANAQHMRAVLLGASGDSEPLIRIGAVRGLTMFKDSFTRETLKAIAARDPFQSLDRTFYPVRNEATRALAAMTAKGPRTSAD